jgi:hypothetical protein
MTERKVTTIFHSSRRAGELPPTATRMVQQWALARNAELRDNWERTRAHLALEKIAGPDADE